MAISNPPLDGQSGVQSSIYYRAPAATLASINPILGINEIGQESDTGSFKVGDGETAWNSLSYSELAGPPGPTGSQGIQGVQGVQGEAGPAGADSTVPGPQGIQGLTGPQGLQGVPGADSTVPGPQGIQGVAGPAGYTPVKGVDYFDGAQGPQGLQGDIGPQGIQGLPGADSTVPGPQGIQGIKGDTGNQGIQGIQGPAGADSTVPGPQGEQGIQGIQGIQGPAGSDASVTKPNVEAVLTGEISSHTHAGGGTSYRISVELWRDGANVVDTNQPTALRFFKALPYLAAQKCDLSVYTQLRFNVMKAATAGAAASKMILLYSANWTTTVGSWSNISDAEVSLATNVQNTSLSSGWVNLVAGARGDVHIGIFTSGGDALLDPAFGNISVEFR